MTNLDEQEVYLKRPNTTVIATVRNIEQSGKAFEALSTGQGSKIIVVAISSTDHESPKKAVELLKTTYGIDRIDVRQILLVHGFCD